MKSDEFLSARAERNRSLTERGIAAAGRIGDLDEIVFRQAGSVSGLDKRFAILVGQTPGRIFQHMILANEYALPNIREGLEIAHQGEEDVRHTWFGRMLIKASGPEGSAPTPKFMQPGPGPFGREVVGRWQAQQEEIQAMIENARGKMISRARIRHPIFKLFKMNLADWLELVVSHTERHVEQIEALASTSS